MTDTIETLRAELAAITARVAAFEEARVGEEEPPALTDEQDDALRRCWNPTAVAAVDRLRYCERELARLREGLKRDEMNDTFDEAIAQWASGDISFYRWDATAFSTRIQSLAREIQRHRALLKDGGGK